MASDPRRYLENLTRGRGWSVRVLPQESIEASLDRVLMVGGERRLNQLRDQAREVAQDLGYQSQFKRLDPDRRLRSACALSQLMPIDLLERAF